MFALIGWIGRFLLILLVVRLVLRLFFPTPAQKRRAGGEAAGGEAPRGPFGARKPKGEIAGGQLIRCAKCGTYVPETSAITMASGGAEQKFCSDACRLAYTAAPG